MELWEWASNEPSNNKKCVVIQNTQTGTSWYAADCSEQHDVICTKSK